MSQCDPCKVQEDLAETCDNGAEPMMRRSCTCGRGRPEPAPAPYWTQSLGTTDRMSP